MLDYSSLFFSFAGQFGFGCCSLAQEIVFVIHSLPCFGEWFIACLPCFGEWFIACLPSALAASSVFIY
jgi:hypothetical protein